MRWVSVVALLAGVVVIVWPGAGARSRLPGRRPFSGRLSPAGLPSAAGRLSFAGRAVSPRRVALGLPGLATGAALLAGGPVAGVVTAAYSGLAAREWMRRDERKRAAAGRAAALDGLSALVADMRAGVPPAIAPDVDGDTRIAGLVKAVWRLAEQTGAPAADLLERIESDARAADRAAKAASAQAAGAQATALMLAGLPVGGIGLGYAIGADPLHVLLRTPVGAVCAVAAVALQCAGLLWTQRLISGAGR